MNPKHLILCAASVLPGLVACQQPSEEVPAPVPAASQPTGCSNGFALQEEITFYKDILPIMMSAKDGEVYKCTVCHADYLLPERVGRVQEYEAIMESIESGSMPLQGDKVKPKYLELFKKWRLTGFKEGDPDDTYRKQDENDDGGEDGFQSESGQSGVGSVGSNQGC